MNKQQAGRAIVTYARGWQSLAATRSLGRRGVEVITADEVALTPASFSKYSTASFTYPDCSRNPDEFVDKLESEVIKHKPDDPDTPYVLIPIHKETYVIARHRERFESHIRVPIVSIEQIEAVHNKGTLAAYAQDNGLCAPPTIFPTSIEELEGQADEIDLPAFVKLRESAAGVGIAKVDTREELISYFKSLVDDYGLEPEDYPWLLYRLAVDGRVDSPKDVSYDVKTEVPLVGLLATLQEISKSSVHSDNLKEAWNGARQEFKEGSKREGLRQLLSGLGDYVDIKGRTEKVQNLFEVHKDTVSDVFSSDDPAPMLGALYPLVVFLKHGKINMELLTSESGPAKPTEEIAEDS